MKAKTKPTKVSDQKLPRIEKKLRGGSRPNAGRREKVYSETLIEKKLLIPQSKYQYFTDLAKSEREKVLVAFLAFFFTTRKKKRKIHDPSE